jgi:Tol biopolymer transport system component
LTRLGVIMGTASYMSPEQARGLIVDRGADIWAWGCVLFEMLAGRRAFDGADTTDVIAAVVRGEPDWLRLPSETPAAVRRLLRRCFEKDPKRRLADMRDARFALEDLERDPAPAARGATSGRERLVWIAALVLCIAGAGALLLRRDAPAPAAREMRVEIATPPTTDPASMAISPDGEKLVYVASSDHRSMLWLRSLTSGQSTTLTGTDGASFPFWAPDSRSIGFFANDRLYRIGVDGGSLRELASAPFGTGGTWSREGVILFTIVPDAPLSRVSDAGGRVEGLTQIDRSGGGHRFPQFLPDGRHFLYFMAAAAVRGVYAGTLDGPERRRLFDADSAAVLVPPSSIMFVRAGTLYLQPFDFAALTLQGETVALAKGVVVDATGGVAASASADGSILYRIGSTNRLRQLAWFDRMGTQIGEAFPPDGDNPMNPQISPDGRSVALSRSVGGVVDIWLQDLTRTGARTKLTTSPGPDISASWSTDGRRLVFGRGGNTFGVAQVSASGGDETMVFDNADQEIPLDSSPDGRFILYRSQNLGASIDLWAMPMDGSQKPLPVSTGSADERWGLFSPDGKWIAFESNESGNYEIYVQGFPKPGARVVVSTSGGRQPRWSPDGNSLFYVSPDARLMTVSLRQRADGQLEPSSPVALFQTRISGVTSAGSSIEYDVSRDGNRFLMNTLVEQSGVPITLVLNPSIAKK